MKEPRQAPSPTRAAAPVWLMRGIAAAALLTCGLALAQPAAPTVIEVKSGDTFSGIAARFTGSVRRWKTLYDQADSHLPDPARIKPGMRFELVSEASGRRYLRLIDESKIDAAAVPAAPTTAAAATAAPAPAAPASVPESPAAAASDTLVVGVLPNINAAALMQQYDSMKSYLERQNPQKVRIVLPASFKAFYDSLLHGDYDIAVAAPHFARVAQLDGRMTPLAMYEPRINAQFITTADSAVTKPEELRGKALAFANPQSLVAMYGRQWLHQHGLDGQKDYEVKAARTDMGVGRMLLTGEVSAAIMSNGEFGGLPTDESTRLKIVEIFARIPNFVVLGNPRLGTQKLARLKAEMLGFLADPEDGARFAKATGFRGIVEADESQLRELDPFVELTRRAMAPAN